MLKKKLERYVVIPVETGIQEFPRMDLTLIWTPAFAGVTRRMKHQMKRINGLFIWFSGE